MHACPYTRSSRQWALHQPHRIDPAHRHQTGRRFRVQSAVYVLDRPQLGRFLIRTRAHLGDAALRPRAPKLRRDVVRLHRRFGAYRRAAPKVVIRYRPTRDGCTPGQPHGRWNQRAANQRSGPASVAGWRSRQAIQQNLTQRQIRATMWPVADRSVRGPDDQIRPRRGPPSRFGFSPAST